MAGIASLRSAMSTRWRRAAAVMAALAVLPLTVALSPGQHTSGAGSPVARTQDGLVQGMPAEGTDQFLGIPYAAPPAGALRWQAPQPVRPWSGIRSAASYGSRCPQLASGNGPRADSEDCLYLNVYAPPGAERRPEPAPEADRAGHATAVAGSCRCGRAVRPRRSPRANSARSTNAASGMPDEPRGR